MKNWTGLALGLVVMAMGACVPARKYQEVKESQKSLQNENRGLKEALASLEGDNKDYLVELEQLRKSNSRLSEDTSYHATRLRRMESKFEKLNQLNDELLRKYAALQKGSEVANQELSEELNTLQIQLQEREDELTVLEEELKRRKANLDKISGELEKREARVNELESMLAEKDEKVKSLKERIAGALLGFKERGLSVEEKNGKVYVSLEAKLLFASGSTLVSKEGTKALEDLARVLMEQQGVEILVEGHTDTDKFRKETFPKDNWDLSVLRATSVVRILQKTGVDPEYMIAGGRSEYIPLDALDKSKNRRIEIVISPNLDALFDLIEEEQEQPENTEE